MLAFLARAKKAITPRIGCTTLAQPNVHVVITPRVPIKGRTLRGSFALSDTACSRVLDVSRTINAWECLVGGPCVRHIPNVKSVVKCWMFFNEVKENTSAGKSDVLPLGSTKTLKRTGVFMEPPKKKRKRNREGSDDEDEQEQEEEQKSNFLFFDFECMQETGVHVPILVVVQDAHGHEWVF